MKRKPMLGEVYFYIDDKGNVVCRKNTLQDIDILNGMRGNYYADEAKARLAVCMWRVSGKGDKSE